MPLKHRRPALADKIYHRNLVAEAIAVRRENSSTDTGSYCPTYFYDVCAAR